MKLIEEEMLKRLEIARESNDPDMQLQVIIQAQMFIITKLTNIQKHQG